MLLKPEQLGKVFNREKTHIRRMARPGDVFVYEHPRPHLTAAMHGASTVVWSNGRTRFYIKQLIAVSADEFGLSQGSVRVLGIGREDVRQISEADVKAEGFDNRREFLKDWTSLHDKWVFTEADALGCDFVPFLQDRPANLYQAWVLTVEPVEK